MSRVAAASAGVLVLLLASAPRRRSWRRSSPVPVSAGLGEAGGGRRSVALLAVVPIVAALAMAPLLGVVGVAAAAVAHRVELRAAERRRVRAIERALPDLVDLLLIAARAGHPVAPALVQVAPRGPPPLRPALERAAEQLRRGLPLAEVLHHLQAALGPKASSLVGVLAQAALTGAALPTLLAPVAGAAADARRRSAQEAARRLPVALLFPLAACALPAAVLLAVVPVVLVSLASLSS